MQNDPYKILGIAKNASADEIKKAYRKLALQYHPDRGGGKADEEKFKEINYAYEILSNPEKRAQYDQFGQTNFSSQGGNAGGFYNSDFSGFGSDFSGFGGFGDIFGDIFGQAFSQVQAEIKVTPAQATLGDRFQISINGEKIDFQLPPGTQSGTSFRFPGRGQVYRGGKRGDLILTVQIEIPTRLSREQKELWEKIQRSETKKRGWF